MKHLFKHIVLFLFCSLIFLNCKKENIPPVAMFSYYPEEGDSTTIFSFDASVSFDKENYKGALQVRWDFNNDGEWDTDFSYEKQHNYCFPQSGLFNVRLEVIDNGGLSGSVVKEMYILSENIKSTLTDERDGRVYKIVRIEDQWWMSENLNYGTQIKSNIFQTDNDTVEKYFFYNNDSLGNIHGGLYEWDEAMNYSKDTSAQGICPSGWHIPTQNDWNKVLEKYNPTVAQYYEPEGQTGLDFITTGMLWHDINIDKWIYRRWRNKSPDGYYVENFWTSEMIPRNFNQASINFYAKYKKQLIYYLDLYYTYPFKYGYSSGMSAMPIRCVKYN
ncbi:FISUMP domain-containing protein [Bacteroidota bacterium]